MFRPGANLGCRLTGLHRALSKHLGNDRRSCSRPHEIRLWMRPPAVARQMHQPRPRIRPWCRRAISAKAAGRTPVQRSAHVQRPGCASDQHVQEPASCTRSRPAVAGSGPLDGDTGQVTRPFQDQNAPQPCGQRRGSSMRKAGRPCKRCTGASGRLRRCRSNKNRFTSVASGSKMMKIYFI